MLMAMTWVPQVVVLAHQQSDPNRTVRRLSVWVRVRANRYRSSRYDECVQADGHHPGMENGTRMRQRIACELAQVDLGGSSTSRGRLSKYAVIMITAYAE